MARASTARRAGGPAAATSVLYEPGRVQLERLHFDPENPRLPSSINGKDEAAVLRWMLDDATLLELAGAIASEGYFPGEPVLVSPVTGGRNPGEALQDPSQEFVVVEGNRRLAAVRLLKKPSLAPTRRRAVAAITNDPSSQPAPTELPVIAFRTRLDVLDHMGFRHVTGVKAWSPFAKANYVRQLVDRAHRQRRTVTHEEIARMIGSKAWYVGRLLTTLAIVERLQADRSFFKSLDISEEDLPFSLMLVALGRPDIVTFLGLASANAPDLKGLKRPSLRRLATWLFKKRPDGRTALGESRNMTYLTQVVKSSEAMDALDKGESIRASAVLSLDAKEILRVSIDEADRQIDLALRQRNRVKAVDAATAEKAARLASKAAELEEFASKRRRTRKA